MRYLKIMFISLIVSLVFAGFDSLSLASTSEGCDMPESCVDEELIIMNCEYAGDPCHWKIWHWYWDNCELIDYPCFN